MYKKRFNFIKPRVISSFFKEGGFTLIELLIVIGVVAILASAVIVAIDPGHQFAGARDSTRQQHINSLQSSLLSYQVDNQGGWGGIEFDEELTEICNTNMETYDCDGMVDLSPLTDEGYINQIPVDPEAEGDGAGYKIARGSVVLVAPNAETEFIAFGVSEDEYEDRYVGPETITPDENGYIYNKGEYKDNLAEGYNSGDEHNVFSREDDYVSLAVDTTVSYAEISLSTKSKIDLTHTGDDCSLVFSFKSGSMNINCEDFNDQSYYYKFHLVHDGNAEMTPIDYRTTVDTYPDRDYTHALDGSSNVMSTSDTQDDDNFEIKIEEIYVE